MAKVSTYLNFTRSTEEAFLFYKKIFGTDFVDGIHRFSEVPSSDDNPPLSENDKNLVMNVQLPILGGHVLMGTDAPESMGFKKTQGNSIYINLQTDSRSETEQLFNGLSEGGHIEMALQDMFWGDYFGSCVDKFGVHWMFTFSNY